jgi:hypothetical protein
MYDLIVEIKILISHICLRYQPLNIKKNTV